MSWPRSNFGYYARRRCASMTNCSPRLQRNPRGEISRRVTVSGRVRGYGFIKRGKSGKFITRSEKGGTFIPRVGRRRECFMYVAVQRGH